MIINQFDRFKKLSSKNLYSYSVSANKYFIKILHKSSSFYQSYVSKIKMRREIDFYENSNLPNNGIQIPKLFETDGESYLILEFIDKIRPQSVQEIINNLINIQCLKVDLQKIYLHDCLFNENIEIIKCLCKSLNKRSIKFNDGIKVINFLFISNLRSKKLRKPILKHGDYHTGNLLVKNISIVTLDFENTKYSRRWVMFDIYRFAINNRHQGAIEKSSVQEYINRARDTLYSEMDNESFLLQNQVGLLYASLLILSMDGHRNNWEKAESLVQTSMNRNNTKKWLSL